MNLFFTKLLKNYSLRVVNFSKLGTNLIFRDDMRGGQEFDLFSRFTTWNEETEEEELASSLNDGVAG